MPVNIGFVNGLVMTVVIFFGVVGNSLTLFAISRYRPLRDVTGMFLANLAAADLLQSVIGMPLIAASSFKKKWIFGDTLCTISGMTNSLFCMSSVLTLTAVGIDRWLAIRCPLKYQTLLTPRRAGFVLVYIWCHAVFVAFLPVFGWSRYVYLPYEFICTVQWEHDKAYTIFLSVTCFIAPLIVTFVCYSSITQIACHQARENPLTTIGKIEPLPNHEPASDVGQENCEVPDINDVNVIDLKSGKRMSPSNPNSQSEKLGQTVIFIRQNSHRLSPPSVESELSRTEYPSAPSQDGRVKNSVEPSRHPNPSGRPNSSRVRPKSHLSRSKGAWSRNGAREAHLTIITEADETEGGQELRVPSLKDDRSPSHLFRVREWMAERLVNRERTEAQGQRKKEMKVFLTLLVLNGTFVLCWLPHFVGIMCLTFTDGSCPFPDSFFIITTSLAMLNSGCNPFIYTLTYRKFKTAFKKVLPCFRRFRTRVGFVDDSFA